MKKLGLLISLCSFVLISCTNQSKKEANENQNSGTIDQSVIDSHTPQESLDWAGIYLGNLPCADCEGIEAEIELKENYTFVATYTYLGKQEDDKTFSYNGSFTWDILGSNITLESKTETLQFRVGENELILLDAEGDVNVGDLSHLYVLKKKI